MKAGFMKSKTIFFNSNKFSILHQDAEQSGYTAEDIQVSLNHCGDVNPVSWLRENWDNMMDTVVTLASNVGHEAEENTIGTLSKAEAKEALRKHKGNIWAAVTECVEQRQMRVRSILQFQFNNFCKSHLV
jgi:E3 ubiquitin-protein ligase RNF31